MVEGKSKIFTQSKGKKIKKDQKLDPPFERKRRLTRRQVGLQRGTKVDMQVSHIHSYLYYMKNYIYIILNEKHYGRLEVSFYNAHSQGLLRNKL